MAGAKDAGEAKPQSDLGLYIIFIFVILGFVIFGMGALFEPKFLNLEYFFQRALEVVGPIGEVLVSGYTWRVVGIVSGSISLLSIIIIVFSAVRMYEIQRFEITEIEHEISLAMARDYEEEQKQNPKWKYILKLIEGATESEWRMAIIEADAMLEEVMFEKGYSGETLGDKLKSARGDAFSTLDNAWNAHEVRNKIAHEGSEFTVTQMEARRIIRLYETVFEELGAI